jgi:hypothetical protein
MISEEEWRASWLHEGGTLAKERPIICFEINFPAFKKMFPFFLKRKGATSRENREDVGGVWLDVLATL